MDPNTALETAREAVVELTLQLDGENFSSSAIEQESRVLRDAFESLDEWLTKGGFLPSAWAGKGETNTCRHCQRTIIHKGDGRWVDPEARGDDIIWRETCESNETFTAEHEPEEKEKS